MPHSGIIRPVGRHNEALARAAPAVGPATGAKGVTPPAIVDAVVGTGVLSGRRVKLVSSAVSEIKKAADRRISTRSEGLHGGGRLPSVRLVDIKLRLGNLVDLSLL
jgi:hypothetical protein